MDDVTRRFEGQRERLRSVAYRMLGSLSEADDAVQEAWIRLSRADTAEVANLDGWLTTVVARVCVDMLRSRKSRRETGLEPTVAAPHDLEHEAAVADSVGIALLVVLELLTPAERLAFVLHDMFAMPFEEIAPIVGRTPTAARKLASRARRRVQGATPRRAAIDEQRRIVDAFLAARRAGDFEALVAVLDPDVVVRGDAAAGGFEIRGAAAWAKSALAFSRAHPSHGARPALIEGSVGLVLAPRGTLERALRFGFAAGRIHTVDIVADPQRLRALEIAVLDDAGASP